MKAPLSALRGDSLHKKLPSIGAVWTKATQAIERMAAATASATGNRCARTEAALCVKVGLAPATMGSASFPS